MTSHEPLPDHQDTAPGAPDDLETTVRALEGGVTSLMPSTALGLIRRWARALASHDDESLRAIAADLADLEHALTADRLDGRRIGALLSSLADHTSAVSAHALDEPLRTLLGRLATALARAGRALAPAPSSIQAPHS